MRSIIPKATREAYARNRKALLDEYKRSGRIKMIIPRDPAHARLLAKLIADKIRKENKHHG